MSQNKPNDQNEPYIPRLIAWEVTRSCYLHCKHCRAGAQPCRYEKEFSSEECFSLLENIAGFARPIIILTGGEPMLRPDIYQIARHGHNLGLRMVMAPCGALVDDDAVQRMLAAGISCISLSLDGATAGAHDGFRRVAGSFATVTQAAEAARRGGLDFQINTTITRGNLDQIGAIMELAERLGAITFNPFLLVPTGRGKALADQALSPEQYEKVLHWLNAQRGRTTMTVRVTCAPHYQRIIRQHPQPTDHRPQTTLTDPARKAPSQTDPEQTVPDRKDPAQPEKARPANPASDGSRASPAAGCMGGKSFAFISHLGKVQICGFLEEPAGDLRENGLDFEAIWRDSAFLKRIRAVDAYRGKCGWCEYRYLCGGCRARAFALTGDPLASEPFCVYEPKSRPAGNL
ncbi:MAG: radical SAM protein [Sedimentisphaerales bacterium]|nr:radical SAM protein [Sedimentisphaerales bacterium]